MYGHVPTCKACRMNDHADCDGVSYAFANFDGAVQPCFCRERQCACSAIDYDGRVACIKRRGHTGLHVWKFNK